jgi:hypothetical protein
MPRPALDQPQARADPIRKDTGRSLRDPLKNLDLSRSGEDSKTTAGIHCRKTMSTSRTRRKRSRSRNGTSPREHLGEDALRKEELNIESALSEVP